MILNHKQCGCNVLRPMHSHDPFIKISLYTFLIKKQEEDHAYLRSPSHRRQQPGAQLLWQPAESPSAAAAGDVLFGWASEAQDLYTEQLRSASLTLGHSQERKWEETLIWSAWCQEGGTRVLAISNRIFPIHNKMYYYFITPYISRE